jgi:molecular chaperone GrpE
LAGFLIIPRTKVNLKQEMTEKELPEEKVQQEDQAAEGKEAAEDKKDKTAHHKHKKESRIEKLEEELAQLNDKYLRLYSEFDNFRKRTLKEKIELGKTASAEVILSLLPVIDDFERAIQAFESSGDNQGPVKDGITLIYNKWMNILSQQGLEPVQAIGETFNTDFHEAVTNLPAPEENLKGKVIDEVLKGYLLNGKVIRFAKVVVGV